MRICSYLDDSLVLLDVDVKTKGELLRFVAKLFTDHYGVEDPEVLLAGFFKREETMSTGIGEGIALPHTMSGAVKKALVALIRLKAPIDFKSLDNNPVDIVLAFVVPKKHKKFHIRLLAGISRLCKEKDFLDAVRTANDPCSLHETILNIEKTIAFH